MKTCKKTLIGAAVAVAAGFGGVASASVIDTFEDPAGPPGQRIQITSGTAFDEYGPGTNIIGGYRDLFIEYDGDGIAASTLQVAGGSLRFSNDSGAGSIGKVTWDGLGGNGDDQLYYGLDADLIYQEGCPDSGCDRFLATVLRADAGFEYKIGVYTDASNYSIFTANTLFAVTSPIPADYLFEWFNRTSGNYNEGGFQFNIQKVGTVDFTNVNALQLVINSSNVQDVDLQLDIVGKTGVPEPGTMALLGAGLLGLGALRRRKALKA